MIAADVTALEPLLDKGFAHIHSSGTVDTRESFLERVREGDLKYHAIDCKDVDLLLEDGLAIERGRIRIDVDVSGAHRIVQTRYIETWVNRGGDWRVVVYASLGLP